MENKAIKKFLESIDTKLCIDEINQLLLKEADSKKVNPISIHDLLRLESSDLVSTYHEIYGDNSEFLYKDFYKLYFLIQNFKYNMFINKDVRCFLDNNDESVDKFINEDLIGLNQVMSKFNQEFNVCLLPENILMKQYA